MIVLWRFFVIQILLLWQGGFLFYVSFVVPAGTQLLGKTGQGAITARVTDSLNIVGVIGIAMLLLELHLARDPHSRRTACRWGAWVVAMLCQFVLFYFHMLLDSFMDDDRKRVIVQAPFYPAHRVYLWASTVQWVACLLLMWWTLRAWKTEDSPVNSEH